MAKKKPDPDVIWRTGDFQDEQGYLAQFSEARREHDERLAAYEAKRAELEAEMARRQEELERSFSSEIATRREALRRVRPIERRDVESIPMQRAAYSDRMAALMAKLSMLGYVRFEDEAKREVLRIALEEGGLKLIGAYAVDDTEAFLAECDRFVVLVFRGTTSKRDRKTDFRIGVNKVKVPGHPAEVRVHKGFYEAFHLIEPLVRQDLDQKTGRLPIFITGHSLGGALALVASAALTGEDPMADRIAACYTFGAPRVGNQEFRRAVKVPHYRLVNAFDVVPSVPPSWVSGYTHTGVPRLLRRDADEPEIRQSAGWTVLAAAVSVLLWPFSRQLMFLRAHDISRYAARLQRIAEYRGSWS